MKILYSSVLFASVTVLANQAGADAFENFRNNSARLSQDYGHLEIGLGLDGCQNRYVSRVRSERSIAFNSTFTADGQDAYINRFMIAFFGPDGAVMDPFAEPASTRTILDGGGTFDWTDALRANGYRVPIGTSLRIIDTGDLNWMVLAEPSADIPNYVPQEFYTNTRVESGLPSGFDFAYHLVILHDDSNTENRTDDDQALSDCVFFYVDS